MNQSIRKIFLFAIFFQSSFNCVFAENSYVKASEEDSVRATHVNSLREISGVVVDAQTGEVLMGVTIYDDVEKKGTTTNIDGSFSICVSDKAKDIKVSFVGYVPQTVKLNRGTTYLIRLVEASEMLSEVVVTGIQTIERGRATGSFNIVRPEDMSNIYSTNISQKLEGTVPGLLVDKDNNITIRGLGSLNADTRPLIVVDGFPLESSEYNLNPNDIEQISVLKDAASASIWGIRAANGVIVITTKRGGKGKINVNYSGNITYNGKPDWNDLHILSSDQYVTAKFQSILDQGISNTAFGGMNELEKIYHQYDNGNIGLDNAWSQVNVLGKFSNSKQIVDNFYRNAFTQQHNISLSGGGERTSTYISLSYDQNRAQEVGNEYNKFNLLVNNDFRLHRTFTVGINVRGTYRYSKNDAVDMTSYEPWQRILNDDGSYYNEFNGVSDSWQDKCYSLGMVDWHKNSLEMLRMNHNRTKEYNLSSSLKLNWNPIHGLDIMVQGNYEFGNSSIDNFYSQNHFRTRDLTNRFTEVEIEDATPIGITEFHLPTSGGLKNIGNTNLQSYSIREIISYHNSFKDFDYKILAGNEVYSLEGEQNTSWLFGFNPDLLTSQSVNLKQLQEGVYGYNGRVQTLDEVYSPTYSETLQRYVSWFGTANISFRDTYDLFASVRLDQTNMLVNSSKFRNNPSWSIGGKWNIGKEQFLHYDWINNLALRLSYGLTGNIDKSTGPDLVASASSDYNIPSLNYLMVTNPANPALGWEKTYTWNAGVDYMFFNNRLSGSIDFYHKLSKGLLANVDLDPTTGWGQIYKNTVTVQNVGLDVAIRGRAIQTRDFRWELGLNLSYNKNKVTEINYQPSRKGACKGNPMAGQPIGYIAVHRYGGLDEIGEPTFMKKGDETKYSYDEMYLLKMDDLEFVGSVNPPVFGSLSTSLTYKDFTLGAMFTFRFGSKMRLPNPNPTNGLYTEWMGEKYRWIEGTDNTGKWVPRLYTESDWVSQNREDCLLFSDQMIDKGDAIYFRSIRLTYNASRLLQKIGINGGSVSIGGENLGHWFANRLNLDPDQLTSGWNTYESVCTLGKTPRLVVGLNINL
ncbi:MAG: SusC/RagA family TonB-linked outer membrane protein [Bacteroidales bacterium]|nr:SusC/RagA family TonB-linked outer membrane protein [Bacteroidales bacterium]MCM1146469.1 SusC/RagA family TonB-linked outer membrane protein [Bacteroidales bacterium]MCM1205093.1 SusC/RagA family TonB-linked outer membrane protein [Bacillota bacterium]MCM1509339.1 SusC/RagA family TonB-linked outer membrane protein [Clostridium sp.]